MTEAFHETQRMRQWWMVGIVIMVAGLGLWGFIQQVILGEPWGTEPAPDWVVTLLTAVLLAIGWILLSLRLKSTIDPSGVTYRFLPFHRRARRVTWDAIMYCYVRTYRPLREYGGWGLRYGFGTGWAFNVRGKMGLQLVLRNGRKILIGTQRPHDLTGYLQSIHKHITP